MTPAERAEVVAVLRRAAEQWERFPLHLIDALESTAIELNVRMKSYAKAERAVRLFYRDGWHTDYMEALALDMLATIIEAGDRIALSSYSASRRRLTSCSAR